MGLADADDRAGWSELTATQGVWLEYQGTRVMAVVNFPDRKQLMERGELNFEEGQVADVRVDNANIPRPPQAGASFFDPAEGYHLRVKSVRLQGREWVMEGCEVSHPEKEFLP